MPRAGLNRQRVIDEAAAVADEGGLERLTMAAVAHRLGVSLPALYKHVGSVAELRRDLAVRGVAELTAAMAGAAVGRSGRDALRATARAYRDYAAAHPGLSEASIRAPDPDDAEHLAAGAAAVGVLHAILAGYGVGGDDEIHAIRMLRVVMHGFVTLERAGGFGLPQSVDETFSRLVDALDLSLRSASATGTPAPGPT